MTMTNRVVWGVVYAAGYGRRFGGYKQFERLAGEERLVDRCVRVARTVCDGIVVVIPTAFVWDGPLVERAVPGGETNPDSVRAGVEAVPAEAEIVDTDAQAIAEPAGAVCATVPGSPFNLHVTTRLDLEVVRRLAPLSSLGE
jgi:2-C-methyl-D-erythritol 4-phosphate cytidylyltransferase